MTSVSKEQGKAVSALQKTQWAFSAGTWAAELANLQLLLFVLLGLRDRNSEAGHDNEGKVGTVIYSAVKYLLVPKFSLFLKTFVS